MLFYIFISLLFLMPALQSRAYIYWGEMKPHPLLLSLTSAVTIYLFLQVSVLTIEWNLQAKLDAFDLNGDGFFSGEEITPEQNDAMMRVISDTGRTFAPIVHGVFCSVYFVLLYFVLYLVSKISVWFKKTKEK